VPLETLETDYLDNTLPLFKRYKAMFAIRNKDNEEAALILTKGFIDKSALFRHEVAYVLGQMMQPVTTDALQKVLEDEEEVVAGEASEVAEDLEDHSEEGVISAVDSEDEEDLEEEVVSAEEVAADSEEELVVRAVRDHLGLKKHHKPNFFIHHQPPAVIGKLFSTPAVSTFSTKKQSLFSF